MRLITALIILIFVNFVNAEIREKGVEYPYEDKNKNTKKHAFNKYLDISVGTWYINWQQNDSPDNKNIDYIFEHKFKIENSFAKEVSLSGKYKYVRANIKFITSKGDKVQGKQNTLKRLISSLVFNTSNIDVIFRYVTSSTEGIATGFDEKTQNKSYIEFDTDITMLDLSFYPSFLFGNYLGLGFKYLEYTLPQSFYIIHNNTVISRMVEPSMTWKAQYIFIELTNLNKIIKKVEKSDNRGWNIFADIKAGYAYKVNVNGKAISDAEQDEYLKGKKGYFGEIDLGILYHRKFIKMTKFYLKTGYRYSMHILETEKEGSLYIYSKAETVFNGPYINLSIMF